MRWHKATIEKLGGADIIADSVSSDDLAISSIIATLADIHGESSGSYHHSDSENHTESDAASLATENGATTITTPNTTASVALLNYPESEVSLYTIHKQLLKLILTFRHFFKI